MNITLAFDVYGTLVNTHGVVLKLKELVDDIAEDFSHTWREKQLEYSFRRGLMRNYEQFSVCISNALDYTCAYYKVKLTNEDKNALLNTYRSLPAFDDIKPALTDLYKKDFRLFAFSNGRKDVVENILTTADIRQYFLDIISVDDIKSFKPDPAVYQHFLSKTETNGNNTWLISSNPFDIIGAINAGMKAAWLKRSDADLFDPWDIQPTLTITNLSELKEKIETD